MREALLGTLNGYLEKTIINTVYHCNTVAAFIIELLKGIIIISTMASHKDTKIDCSKVYVKTSSFATKDNQFDGAFAAVPIKEGEYYSYAALKYTGQKKRPTKRTPTLYLLCKYIATSTS